MKSENKTKKEGLTTGPHMLVGGPAPSSPALLCARARAHGGGAAISRRGGSPAARARGGGERGARRGPVGGLGARGGGL